MSGFQKGSECELLMQALTQVTEGARQLVAAMENLAQQFQYHATQETPPPPEVVDLAARLYAIVDIKVLSLSDKDLVDSANRLKEAIRELAQKRAVFR